MIVVDVVAIVQHAESLETQNRRLQQINTALTRKVYRTSRRNRQLVYANRCMCVALIVVIVVVGFLLL